MLITGLALGDFERITYQVGAERYAGNLTVHQDAHELTGNRFRARVVACDSHGTGARTSASGRHGPYACWHAYRDVLATLFARDPAARVQTMHAIYCGRDGFAREYPPTALHNLGSVVSPVTMPQLCDCPDDRRQEYTDHQDELRDDAEERYGAILARIAGYPAEIQRQAAEYAETTYAETITHIDDVLAGMDEWEREITAEQYRKDRQS